MYKIIIIIIFLLNSFFIFSINRGEYKSITLNNLTIKIFFNNEIRLKRFKIFDDKYNILIKIKKYPSKINEKIKDDFSYFKEAESYNNFDDEYFNSYKYIIEIPINGIDSIFLFQEDLYDKLFDNVHLNKIINLYAVLGLYNKEKNHILLFVNDFK